MKTEHQLHSFLAQKGKTLTKNLGSFKTSEV